MATILRSCTHPRWFAASATDLRALLSDHLHCERKAAENALSLVRRYPHQGASVTQLSRLAHEETSHVVQVAALLGRRGWTPRADFPNLYRTLVSARNERWLPQLKRLLDSPQNTLVVVGALHLVGAGGLLELLRRDGFEPQPVP